MLGNGGYTEIYSALRRTFAFILAGGRGSRLKHLTESQAKPAIPLRGSFRIIDFPLSNCINSGIRKVAIPTQYRSNTLIQHVQRSWGFMRPELGEFVSVWPAQQQTAEETWYKGTADAIWQNIDFFKLHYKDIRYVLVLAGDHVYKQNYALMLRQHIERGADVTVSCIEVPTPEASRFGIIEVNDQDRIIGFAEKPEFPAEIPSFPNWSLASMGIYIFNYDFLMELLEEDSCDLESTHDFGKDILPSIVNKASLYVHRFQDSCVRSAPDAEAYWRDVGTVDSYWEANMDLTAVVPALDLYDHNWPIWTYQAQNPSAKFVFDNADRRGMAVDSLISGGCIVSGSLLRRSLLSPNVRLNSYSIVEDSVLLPNSTVGRHCRLKRILLGQNCHVPQGTVIGEDPDLDLRYFYRTDKGTTLVTHKMLDDMQEARDSRVYIVNKEEVV